MRSAFLAVVMLLVSMPNEAAARRRVVTPPGSWNASLTIDQSGVQFVGSTRIASSSSLRVGWTAPAASVDHYSISAADTAGAPALQFTAPANATTATLTALASGTEYRVTIAACLDAVCANRISASSGATARTDEEYWRVRGSGSSYATADHIVSDGNTKAYALLWGSGAGVDLEGHAQLYYDPIGGGEKGVKIGTSGALVTSADSVAQYTPLSGFGFRRNDGQGQQGTGPATFQVIALSEKMGKRVRLIYEAADVNGRGRIYSVDSRDGWTGRDFNSGAATICQESDLVAGGLCEATMLVGGDSDGNPRVRDARQFKVGFPTLSDWRWDGAPGTFMAVTIHLLDASCSSTFFNMGLATWDGSRWRLQYGSDGCPRLISGVQAPMPVHIGGNRYKLYFNHNQSQTGAAAPSGKPMKLLYADAASSGDRSSVEFDDWEPIARARAVHYLWPNGVELTTAETSMLDDYHVWMPTNDPALQVIYSNMSCPSNACGAPFIGMAVLLNP